MLDTVITDSLGSLKTDVVGIAALYLIALVGIQGFRRMRYAAEFDSQYKKASQADPDGYRALSSESRQAWRKEYIASRAGGTRRLQAQRIQQGVFNGSRFRALGDAKKQYSPRRLESKSKTTHAKQSQSHAKKRFGVPASKNKLANFKYTPTGERKTIFRARTPEQRAARKSKNPKAVSQPVYDDKYYQDFEANFQKNNPQIRSRLSLVDGKFHDYQSKAARSTLDSIRSSRAKNGKVW